MISGNMTLKEYYDTRGQGYEGQKRNRELACIIKERFLPAGETVSYTGKNKAYWQYNMVFYLWIILVMLMNVVKG